MTARTWNWLGPAILVVIGTLQMIGDLTGVSAIKGIGAASAASPAPKVFTAHEGFETYSGRFFVLWTDRAGQAHELHLTPEVYAGVRGPYNRRNAYGAALSYAPVLFDNEATRPMLDAAVQHTFCGGSTILEEIGIDRNDIAGAWSFELRPRQELPSDHRWQLMHRVTCND